MTSTQTLLRQPSESSFTAPSALRMDHLFDMTTDIGIWQHAKGSKPDRRHGYSIDDQARALIVAIDYYRAGIERSRMAWLGKVAFDFLTRAAITTGPNAGRFHNFCDQRGKWLDRIGSDDSLGRTIWALGVVCEADLPFAPRKIAEPLLVGALARVSPHSPSRTIAFTLLGLKAGVAGSENIETLADGLTHEYHATSAEDWEWFENYLTYCNARLPMAMFLAARALPQRTDFAAIGCRTLDFLLKTTRNEQGSYSPIGNEYLTTRGWYVRGDDQVAVFDQQPVDAGALVECCALAYSVTGNPKYREAAYDAYGWYFGRNYHNLPVYQSSSGGVADAVTADGVSANMGAESVVSVHLAQQALSSIE